jgi:hypothetical protein
LDGGVTWGSPIIVSSIDTNLSLTDQTMDRAGNVHLLQLTNQDNVIVLEQQMWNGSGWISQNPKEIYLRDQAIPSSITASVSSKGNLLTYVLADDPNLANGLKSSISSLNKSLNLPEEIPSPYPAIIPVAEAAVVLTEATSEVLQSPTQISPATDLNTSSSSLSQIKNLVGILLVGGILILIIVIFRPISRKPDKLQKTS